MIRATPELEDFGLDPGLLAEIRARESRRRLIFSGVMGWGSAIIWICWSVGLYAFWLRGGFSRIWLALGLGFVAAAFAALPLSILAAFSSWALSPRHARALDLERYEAARAHVRPCDVCRLALGDERPKPGVSFCPRCDAFVCESCRRRYDLRAIAALKRRMARPHTGSH